MKTSRRFNRRSFLTAVSGAGALIAVPRSAQAMVQGCSDTDSGPGADPGGRGRTCGSRPQTGVTDTDRGPGADPAGRGRRSGLPEMHGGQRRANITDSDRGAGADPAGRGRGNYGEVRSGLTDSDRGTNADPAGNGRGVPPDIL
jgi:hypothetical protein